MSISLFTVSQSALIRRINRKLAPDDEILRTARRYTSDCGWYYIHDVRRNFVTSTHVDPETLGRELGVLRSYETVAQEAA